jgi:hypothetical protein
MNVLARCVPRGSSGPKAFAKLNSPLIALLQLQALHRAKQCQIFSSEMEQLKLGLVVQVIGKYMNMERIKAKLHDKL